jgi:hypothetical protein
MKIFMFCGLFGRINLMDDFIKFIAGLLCVVLAYFSILDATRKKDGDQ